MSPLVRVQLERKQQDLELTVVRQMDKERARLVTQTQERLADEHHLKDAEKEATAGRHAPADRGSETEG